LARYVNLAQKFRNGRKRSLERRANHCRTLNPSRQEATVGKWVVTIAAISAVFLYDPPWAMQQFDYWMRVVRMW
jgi:hypothetical protein